MFTLPDHPQSIAHVLRTGFSLAQTMFKSLFVYVLIACFCSYILTIITADFSVHSQNVQLQTWVYYLLLLCFIVLFFNADLSIYRLHTLLMGEKKKVSTAMLVKRLVMTLVAYILYTISLAVGTVLLIMPGIIVLFSFIFFNFLIMTEGYGVLASLKESRALVKKNFFRTAITLMIPYIGFFVVQYIIQLTPNKTLENISISILSGVFLVLSLGITYTCMRDLQVRKALVKLEPISTKV